MKKMNKSSLYLIIALILTVVSLFEIGIIAYYLKGQYLTGRIVQDNATLNVTVSENVVINFTTRNINWGSGYVQTDQGKTYAVLDTAAGSVVNGTWTPVSQGFVLQNIGNVNATINIATLRNAADMIGGTSPIYKFNVTNSNPSQPACLNATSFALGTYYDVNKTGIGTRVCDKFNYISGYNSIRIDIRIGIPYDSYKGALNDTIMANAAAA